MSVVLPALSRLEKVITIPLTGSPCKGNDSPSVAPSFNPARWS
jgi:hypothetical protein